MAAMNIFLVEDAVSIRRLIVRRLNALPGMRVVGEASGESQALALIRWTQPDVVLVDLSLASGSGLGVVGELRRTGFAGRIAVLTAQDLDAYRRASFDAGANAFYDKASGLELLFDDLVSLARHDAQDAESRPATLLRDGLTGLYDGGYLLERLEQAAQAATLDGVDVAVYVLRLAGLAALHEPLAGTLAEQVACRLREACAPSDIVERCSVDQFCVVLTHVDEASQAATQAQRLAALLAEPFRVGEQDYVLGLEMGVALFPADAVTPRGLLTLAEASAFGAL